MRRMDVLAEVFKWKMTVGRTYRKIVKYCQRDLPFFVCSLLMCDVSFFFFWSTHLPTSDR